MKRTLWILLLIVVLGGAAWFTVVQYGFVFRKEISGVVVDVKQITSPMVMGSNVSPAAFSYAVAIRQKDGAIITSSAQDRQWAVVAPGMCVDATVDPYPPWNLNKEGTYYNARLIQQMDCDSPAAKK